MKRWTWLVVASAGLALGCTVKKTEDKAIIEVDTKKAEKAVEKATDAGKKAANKLGEGLEKAGEKIQEKTKED